MSYINTSNAADNARSQKNVKKIIQIKIP